MTVSMTMSAATSSLQRALPSNALRTAATAALSTVSSTPVMHHHLRPPPQRPVASTFRALSLLSRRQPHHVEAAISPSLAIYQKQQQRRSLFIQTSETPNPESLKFIPNGRLVLGHIVDSEDTADPDNGEIELDGDESNNNSTSPGENIGVHLTRKDHELISRSPLAKMLFNLDPGVKSIYLGYDFLTVTKYAEAHWSHLQTPIFGAIMDFYATNQPALRDVPEITDTTILDDDDEVVAMIKELLETRIRPAVQEDGGDIKYVTFEEDTGIVTVQLAGSCVGCPSSSVTLKNGVENMLMHYIPEVTGVVSLEEEEDDGDEYEGSGEIVVEQSVSEETKRMKTYQDKLAAAGIPFSD